MGISIKNVAELAKVSTSTVSHVINKTRKVNIETEKKVLNAIKTLNYNVNPIARNLRSGNSKMIGYVVSNLSDFFLDIGLIIEEELKTEGYQLIYINSAEDSDKEMVNISKLIMQSVDGLIIAPVTEDCNYMNDLIGDKCPSIFLDRKPTNFIRDCVMSTNFQGAFQGTEILLKKGHKRIGFIGSKFDGTAYERVKGYQSALSKYGFDIDDNLVKYGKYTSKYLNDLKHSDCYKLAKELLEDKNVTALFCGNNIASIGVISYLKDMNINVPDDIDVVCFDDPFWLSLTYPSISVIDQDWEKIGRTVAKKILYRIKHKDEPYINIEVPTKLILR